MRLTERRAEWVSALQEPGRYLLTRSGASIAPSMRACLTGCHVIELVDGQEVSVLQVHRNSAAELVEDGYLKQHGDRPLSGKLYQLTDKGMAIKTGGKVTRRPDGVKERIMLSDVDTLAAKYGCHLKRIKARSWYELERKSGEALRYPTLVDQDGKPMARLSDLTLEGWAKAIESCIERNKA